MAFEKPEENDKPFLHPENSSVIIVPESKLERKAKEAREKEENIEKGKFREETEINGINIVCEWDSIGRYYALVFPQIELGEGTEKKGISDMLFYISANQETAKKVFNYAVNIAQNEPDVYEVFKKSEAYARSLK